MSLLTRKGKPNEGTEDGKTARYPGVRAAMDGNTAVIACEREATDGAGAYPITPSTQMGEYWAEAAAKGHVNVSDRPLIFIEPEGEHAAAAVTAGLSMTGLRAANFSSGQGIAYMHESLYAAVGKRLTYVLNIGARAMTKATLNVHAGHDDYHCIDDTGFFQLFAKDAQSAADLNLIAHRIAELSLTPGAIAQDGFLTTHLIESMKVPERALVEEYLGRPDDLIDTPTPAQRLLYGDKRRRIPVLFDVDNPMQAGLVQNQDAYMQSVAAQRPYFFDHLRELSDRAFDEFHALTGRRYERVRTWRCEDADYLLIGQGSVVPTAEAVADYLRESRGIKVGVVDLVMFRPFPADLLGRILKGRKAATVLERLDQPLAVDLPLMREIRATVSKCLENGRDPDRPAHPDLSSWSSVDDAPALHSGSFGLGSRDLQPEGLIGAVENMLPDGPRKRFFYLGIDFARENPATPKQSLAQEALLEAYPQVGELSVRGTENPNLMPEGSITVRMHSVGGWGAITTGKNLAMTLFDLLGWHVKANPKYGSEKKGQPTTYFLSAAPEPIRVNCEYFYVDCVLSPDPNVFHHANPLAGLKDGGVFIIQSERTTPDEVWADIPPTFRRILIDRRIRLFAVDGFKIAREEATDPDLQLRMQGIAFQGAFFAASPVAEQAGLDEGQLLAAIHDQLQAKFGAKGARVVEDNVRVVRRGYDELIEVPHGEVETEGEPAETKPAEPAMPVLLKALPASDEVLSDVHRFWEQTGSFYARGQGNDNLADPYIGLGVMPASSAVFRDMTGIRFEHPDWVPENCTACGKCYTVCPDTAIPGLVSEVGAVLDTAMKRVVKSGGSTEHLPKAVRVLERELRKRLEASAETEPVDGLLDDAQAATLEASGLEGEAREALRRELGSLREALGGFRLALSRPYWTLPEKDCAGNGGLLSITVNPYTCKGCMECVQVCEDDALVPVRQTDESVARLRENWDFWLDLPTTPKRYQRIDDLEEGIGALETLLLDKDNYLSFASGDGACLGCSEKTVMHLFVATVEALMQPRVAAHVKKLEELIAKLREHVQLKLVGGLDVGDSDAVNRIVDGLGDSDLTLAGIAERMEKEHESSPIDQAWLRRVSKLIAALQQLKWKYEGGTTGRGRSRMGMLNATGCTSVWGSTWPYNPYPFPWANHLFQDAASVAMGVFEGHAAAMAAGFRAVRQAELELQDAWKPEEHEDLFRRFSWKDFSDEEWDLCPPIVAVGGDGAMYDIGFQNLSRLMASGKPIKVLVVDTQVYSNTGGQACTSGFLGQISDMAQFGKAIQGKQEPRKEIGLIAMAHRTTFVLQGSIANTAHVIGGFIKGLKARRPALFNLYTSCQPEHGIADDLGAHQARLAVESRAYPLFTYDPGAGGTAEECFDLEGNSEIDADWPTHVLKYLQDGREREMKLPMTFADFALTETRFRKHFKSAPQDTWNENMLPMAEFLELDEDEREGRFPFVWAVDRKQRLTRLVCDKVMVESCEERRGFWRMLRALAGLGREELSREEIETQVRGEVAGRILQGLMSLAGGDGEGLAALAAAPAAAEAEAGAAPAESGDFLAPWIDSAECTSCDECIKLNGKLFAYDDKKHAFILDANAGPYSDLVKAAERCTARVIHPGLPRDTSFKDAEKWIARGSKYN